MLRSLVSAIGDFIPVAYSDYTYKIYDAHNYEEIFSFNSNEHKKIFCFSKNIFSTDNLYAYMSIKEDGQLYHVCVYNVKSEIIADLGYISNLGYPNFGIFKVGSSYKLLLPRITDTYQFDIYSLPGNGTATGVSEVPAKRFAAPYPNPTHGIINLPYELSTATGQMQIFDVNGKLMETRLLSKQNEVLELNTTNYPTGLYFYEVEGTSQSFLVE